MFATKKRLRIPEPFFISVLYYFTVILLTDSDLSDKILN